MLPTARAHDDSPEEAPQTRALGPGATSRNDLGFGGQLRFRTNGSPDTAIIQTRPNAQAACKQLTTAKTNTYGFFTASAPPQGAGAEYRALYFEPALGKIRASSLPDTP